MDQEDFLQTTVRALVSGDLDDLALKLVTGDDGLDRTILRPRVQKPGLAFAGYYEYIKPWRVQIIGESETKYLQSLPARLREKRRARRLLLHRDQRHHAARRIQARM